MAIPATVRSRSAAAILLGSPRPTGAVAMQDTKSCKCVMSRYYKRVQTVAKFADFKITVIYAPELRLFHCHCFITPVKVFNEIYKLRENI